MRLILKRAIPVLVLLATTALGGCYYPYGYYGPYGALYAPPVVIGGGYYHRGYWR